MASPPLMSSPPPLGPTISPAITPPRITKLPSPPPPLAAAAPLLLPAMSPKDHPLPPVVSPPSPPVTNPASPLTSPSPAAVAPPLPSPTVTTSPPPSSPEHPTSPPVSSPPPPSTTTTPLTPQPPPPPPPLPSTASPPLPGPPLVPSRASPPPRPTPKPTPHPPAKLSASPPPPALSPRVPPKATISPPEPVATTPSPPPPRKSTVSRPPVSVTTPLSPTSSPATISSPPTMATPLLSPPTTSSSSFPSPPSSANGSLPTALEIQKPQPNPSRGLIFGCIIGGVVLLLLLLLLLALVLGLLCMCHRRWRKRKRLGFVEHYSKLTSLGPKGNFDAVLPQQHVLPPSLLPTPCIGINVGSASTNSGSEVPNPHQATHGGVALGSSRGTFRYDQLVVATNGFSEANLVGQGGFGYVHKGVLPSGKEVAVKRLRSGSQQGEREFQAEVDTISRVHHKHLVSLVGYCITGAERLLVYEFVPNNNLEFHLHGKEQHAMEWATRLKIALGSAKGLAYLHEDCNPTIIHRDIKAANILLDFGFEAKVSDFGLAKSFSDTNTHISHISTQVVGTFGYLAPEYALSGKVTEKSDVYSYGVVLLELITGRPPIQTTNSMRNESLVEWARPLLNVAMNEGDFDGLVDPKLHQNYNANEMNRVVACAAACVRHSAWLRPRMSQIVHALEGHASLSDLQQRSSTLYGSSASSEYNARHMKMLRDQVYGISGYSDSTSEYGLNPSVSSSEAQQTI